MGIDECGPIQLNIRGPLGTGGGAHYPEWHFPLVTVSVLNILIVTIDFGVTVAFNASLNKKKSPGVV